jgi:hypothetical protein
MRLPAAEVDLSFLSSKIQPQGLKPGESGKAVSVGTTASRALPGLTYSQRVKPEGQRLLSSHSLFPKRKTVIRKATGKGTSSTRAELG